MRRLPNTLAFRLTLSYTTAFLVSSLVTLCVLYFSVNSILNTRMDEDLQEDITEYKMLYNTEGMSRVLQELEREVGSDDEGQVFLRLLDAEGEELFASDLSEWNGLKTNTRLFQTVLASKVVHALETLELEEHEFPVRTNYGLLAPGLILHVGESFEEKEEIMDLLLTVFVGMFCVAIPLASGVGWMIARKDVRGIEAVSRAAVDIERGQLDRRVMIKNQGDEVQTLVDTFNAMAERIRSLIIEMREMTDNIAHDLRSPLSRIRAISERALSVTTDNAHVQAAASDTLEECDRLLHLINTTLDVAEAEAGVMQIDKEPVNISKLVEDARDLFEPAAEEKDIEITCTLESDCQIQGNRQMLQRMLANLLDNALKYTPSHGRVSIDLVGQLQGLRVSIADTGIGIRPEDQRRVFDRFFRCDQSRSRNGCGLGLSFARAVVRAHGGDITLESEPARGSTFMIRLPRLSLRP
ncbi:MAG: two-component sensor histidine kinase [Nitrospirales bacterium]|nr:MAG: two-component sensor histidine kinase [Nitrospirales bacterium]